MNIYCFIILPPSPLVLEILKLKSALKFSSHCDHISARSRSYRYKNIYYYINSTVFSFCGILVKTKTFCELIILQTKASVSELNSVIRSSLNSVLYLVGWICGVFQAVWALGNIAGDNAECRDYVLNCGILPSLQQYVFSLFQCVCFCLNVLFFV